MFTAKTAFEPRVTNDFRDDLINVTGRYQASSADADCDAGRLVGRKFVVVIPDKEFFYVRGVHLFSCFLYYRLFKNKSS